MIDYLRARASSWHCDEGSTDQWIASILAGEEPSWSPEDKSWYFRTA